MIRGQNDQIVLHEIFLTVFKNSTVFRQGTVPLKPMLKVCMLHDVSFAGSVYIRIDATLTGGVFYAESRISKLCLLEMICNDRFQCSFQNSSWVNTQLWTSPKLEAYDQDLGVNSDILYRLVPGKSKCIMWTWKCHKNVMCMQLKTVFILGLGGLFLAMSLLLLNFKATPV